MNRLTNPYLASLTYLCLLLGALLGFGPRVQAQAEPIGFPVDNFKPAASARGFWVTENGTLLGHLHPSVNLYAHYASRPLQLINTDTGDRQQELIKDRLNLDLLMAMGFFDILELGVAVPVTVLQDTGSLRLLDRPVGDDAGAGLRDIRIIPKIQVAAATDNVVALAVALPISVPTGDPQNFLGNDGVTFSPTLILSADTDYFDWAINAGYRLRKDQSVNFSLEQETVAIDDEVFGSMGMKIAFVPEVFELVGDVFVSTSIKEQDIEEIPVETMGGIRLYLGPGLLVHAGGGAGLTRGIGAPEFRVLAGVGYEYGRDPDPDKDGILTEVDSCPMDPEDFDKFEDADGCPEPDNDKDGVLDPSDKCPQVPEDRDGFEDTDGCPDTDNDKDGILDPEDGCPMDPEDVDNFEDTDGCPDADNDKDGLPDTTDKCPMDPEDADQFEDEDGCPDPDNDKDGIPDATDKCPNDPEDIDNFEDTDGCPDPDNDNDGILDPNDKCPMEPETVNGHKDDDGCPDEAKGPVQIKHGKITTPPVFFATGKDVILPKSFPILEMVAQTFKDNPWVKRVRIEGHTDDRGNDNYNLELSQRRAASVMRFLLERGVEAERLESAGYGETRPIASNKKSKGRAKNRRVDFVILDPPQSQNEVQIEP
ncbi:MAG: OmpA family protein [Myxococcales bacterium]|nr:OmpA family protein [Myxococcales bacterium]